MTDEPNWGDISVEKRLYDEGVAGHVLRTPASIGYVVLSEALHLDAQLASFVHDATKLDEEVHANVRSVEAAVMELGLDFGKIEGDLDASHLTADLSNAQGPRTWPFLCCVMTP